MDLCRSPANSYSNTMAPITPTDTEYLEALRKLIRSGVMGDPTLEDSPLLELPVVQQVSEPEAPPSRRAHHFITILRRIVQERLEGREAETAALLFGFDTYAGVPVQDRYRAVAKLYNPNWTWKNYRREPLTRHFNTILLALKREVDLIREPVIDLEPAITSRRSGQSNAVLIVQNIGYEGPGLLSRLLDEVSIEYEVVDLSKGEAFPDPTPYGALVVLGGPDSANDQNDKIIAERQRIKMALDAGVPFLGVCLGLQIGVRVLGGSVIQNHVKEIGLRAPDGNPYSVSLTNLALTALGKKDPLFVGLRNNFRVFQLHGETVTLTKSMQLLATGDHCRNQIVKLRRNAYGIQSHFELTKPMLLDWLKAHPDLSPLDSRAIVAEFEEIEEVYTITGLSLLRNFLHIAGLL